MQLGLACDGPTLHASLRTLARVVHFEVSGFSNLGNLAQQEEAFETSFKLAACLTQLIYTIAGNPSLNPKILCPADVAESLLIC